MSHLVLQPFGSVVRMYGLVHVHFVDQQLVPIQQQHPRITFLCVLEER